MCTWGNLRLYIIVHGICEYSHAGTTLLLIWVPWFAPPSGALPLCVLFRAHSCYSLLAILEYLFFHMTFRTNSIYPWNKHLCIFVGVALCSYMRLKTIDFFTMSFMERWIFLQVHVYVSEESFRFLLYGFFSFLVKFIPKYFSVSVAFMNGVFCYVSYWVIGCLWIISVC